MPVTYECRADLCSAAMGYLTVLLDDIDATSDVPESINVFARWIRGQLAANEAELALRKNEIGGG